MESEKLKMEICAAYQALETEIGKIQVIKNGRVDPIALEHYKLLVAALGEAVDRLQALLEEEGEEE